MSGATSNATELTIADRDALLDVATSSIQTGLQTGQPLALDPAEFAATVRPLRASFVTLLINTELRGCVGSIVPRRPLVVDVAENAFGAAFRDPRFPPLRLDEFATLTTHISILSPMEPLTFRNEVQLLEQIRVDTDGLEIEFRSHRGLFLPSVWEQLPDKRQFWRALKLKAGLPATFWSRRMNVYRFTTESFGREEMVHPRNHPAA